MEGKGRVHHSRPGEKRPAHAPRPHRGGRVPRRRVPRHAPGDEHGPRRLAHHHARQLPREAINRLEVLALMSGLDLPARAIREQIANSVHLVVQQSRFCRRLAAGDGHHRGHRPRRQLRGACSGPSLSSYRTGTGEGGKVLGEFRADRATCRRSSTRLHLATGSSRGRTTCERQRGPTRAPRLARRRLFMHRGGVAWRSTSPSPMKRAPWRSSTSRLHAHLDGELRALFLHDAHRAPHRQLAARGGLRLAWCLTRCTPRPAGREHRASSR
jgi:hypothetical protein